MSSRHNLQIVWCLWAGALVVAAVLACAAPVRAAGEMSAGPKSGLPVPRFVSLKPDRVNVRGGPTRDHEVTFVYTRSGLPVEITAESDNWRRIRDWEGSEGWVYHSLLSGRRTAVATPKDKNQLVPPGWTRLRWLGGAGTAVGRLSEREGGIARRVARDARANTPLPGS